ncbi:unnamed protein product [Acanthoscelides obtectus]|uniref:Uncharacterized protein n=1 Tax=Acanthoscelides obtectus TaxID=200917 RepID=A0A9P0P6L2_ACAOB|nr:unnamed protein product [Acanthoscelides obtectus]CAK1635294.1 hypothetical protein AOBTE_LOCUS9182 [Acanthoscelides obtectus]
MKLNLSEYTETCQEGLVKPEPCEVLFQPIILDEGFISKTITKRRSRQIGTLTVDINLTPI